MTSGDFSGPSLGNIDSILVKLDPFESLIYGTKIVNGNDDCVYDLHTLSDSQLYLTGYT